MCGVLNHLHSALVTKQAATPHASPHTAGDQAAEGQHQQPQQQGNPQSHAAMQQSLYWTADKCEHYTSRNYSAKLYHTDSLALQHGITDLSYPIPS